MGHTIYVMGPTIHMRGATHLFVDQNYWIITLDKNGCDKWPLVKILPLIIWDKGPHVQILPLLRWDKGPRVKILPLLGLSYLGILGNKIMYPKIGPISMWFDWSYWDRFYFSLIYFIYKNMKGKNTLHFGVSNKFASPTYLATWIVVLVEKIIQPN